MRPTHRYLFILAPPPALAAEVSRLRDALLQRIGPFRGRLVVPHLTLCFADLTASHEADLDAALALAAAACTPFSLHYKGITHFPDQHTIYIDVVGKENVGAVRQALVDRLCGLEGVASVLRITGHPHLTIAAGLSTAQFSAAWSLLAPHAFEAEGSVDAFVLLKRTLLPDARYTELRRRPFGA